MLDWRRWTFISPRWGPRLVDWEVGGPLSSVWSFRDQGSLPLVLPSPRGSSSTAGSKLSHQPVCGQVALHCGVSASDHSHFLPSSFLSFSFPPSHLFFLPSFLFFLSTFFSSPFFPVILQNTLHVRKAHKIYIIMNTVTGKHLCTTI